MASEIILRDQNFVPVLAGVTNDASLEIRMLRVDPSNGRLLVSADGSTVAGIDSVLAIGQALTADRTIDLNTHNLSITSGGLVFGTGTVSSGNAAFGTSNSVNDGIAQGASFAFGEGQTIVGEASTALYGFGNNVVDANDALVGGTGSSVSATGAIALGVAATANNIESIALGSNNITNGDYAIVAGGLSNTAQSAQSGVFAGSGNTITGTSSVILGGNNISAARDTTAFAPSLVSFGALAARSRVIADDYSAVENDDMLISANSTSTITVTLPNPDNIQNGSIFIISRYSDSSTGTVTVTTTGGSAVVQNWTTKAFATSVNLAAIGNLGCDVMFISNQNEGTYQAFAL